MSSWTPFSQENSVFRATAAGAPEPLGPIDRPELVKSGHKAKALDLNNRVFLKDTCCFQAPQMGLCNACLQPKWWVGNHPAGRHRGGMSINSLELG